MARFLRSVANLRIFDFLNSHDRGRWFETSIAYHFFFFGIFAQTFDFFKENYWLMMEVFMFNR